MDFEGKFPSQIKQLIVTNLVARRIVAKTEITVPREEPY